MHVGEIVAGGRQLLRVRMPHVSERIVAIGDQDRGRQVACDSAFIGVRYGWRTSSALLTRFLTIEKMPLLSR